MGHMVVIGGNADMVGIGGHGVMGDCDGAYAMGYCVMDRKSVVLSQKQLTLEHRRYHRRGNVGVMLSASGRLEVQMVQARPLNPPFRILVKLHVHVEIRHKRHGTLTEPQSVPGRRNSVRV